MGSNLGNRKAQLDAAVAALAEAPGIVLQAVSRYHETAPVGGPGGQGDYLNAAAAVETTLEPLELLHVLQEIEHRAGRVRTVRWGPRTLDLDLLLFGDRVIATAELQVPHPRMAERLFVLAPLAEIAPAAVDPVTGRTIAELLAACQAGGAVG
jgi:2-amino-4-hydroxy-6-hydroxymethyldihydropteridine diphosphokinase